MEEHSDNQENLPAATQPPEQPAWRTRKIMRPHAATPPIEPAPPGVLGADRPPTRAPGSPRIRLSDSEPPQVVRGKLTKSEYVRVLTTEAQGGFRRRPGGVLEATPAATAPRGAVGRFYGRLKGALVGVPLSTAQLAHERLSKVKALAVFSSDALSSSAYATEEILIVLALAGATHLGLSIPIALAIALLLTIVAISYRQTIRAYPNGGGAYIVARENLGELPGLVAAGALLVEYILTVSVSVAAGVAAITSALPATEPFRVELGVAVIAIVTLLNLRGVRESGTIFAVPTYLFIGMGFALLAVGAIRVVSGQAAPVVYDEALPVTHALTLFLILRAFSSGCAALTGVEAISNGVPAFKPPEAKNAATTLVWMAVILGALFLGITLLTHQYALQPTEGETIVSQLGRQVFGGENVIYYLWQAATALILLLAANTSFADFPRLASLLARDSYMPRQFTFRGDRLAFSNGIIVLGVASAIILTAFGGEVTRLIPLYAVGVFVSFSLSQAGMVIHWRHTHEPGWQRSLGINAVGAVATALVAMIIIVTKFAGGAWISILIGAALVLLFRAISAHYRSVDAELALPTLDEPLPIVSRPQTVLVPVRTLNKPVVRALAYARSISNNVTALHVTDDLEEAEHLREQWERWAGTIPLKVIESPFRSFTQPLLSYIDLLEDRDPETLITLVLPEFVPTHWWQTILHNQDALRLKAALLFRRDTVVVDVPQHAGSAQPTQPVSVGGDGVP